MPYLHVKNLEKYHPGYKDRRLQWAKIYFDMVQGDPDCEQLDEVDWARLLKFIVLELQARKPIPFTDTYLQSKKFNLENRPIELTLQMLQNFVEIVTDDSKLCTKEKRRVREEEDPVTASCDADTPLSALVDLWHTECPSLPSVCELTDDRRGRIRRRLRERPLEAWRAIFSRLEASPFCRGENRSHWRATFDWIIHSRDNAVKVLEGKYDNHVPREIKPGIAL